MDWNAVSAQLADLPSTYKRSGDTYTFLFKSFVMGLLRYTSAADGTTGQLAFPQAIGKWLDTWGQLFNVPRNNDESDRAYATRIQFLLLSGKGPPVSIARYIQIVEGLSATVTEKFPAVGYRISMGLQTLAAYAQIISDLKYVRPAGVPFLPLTVLQGGLYLGTINYLGVAPRVTGAYLNQPFTTNGIVVPATTNNSRPLLPTTFLTDPFLNPSLA